MIRTIEIFLKGELKPITLTFPNGGYIMDDLRAVDVCNYLEAANEVLHVQTHKKEN